MYAGMQRLLILLTITVFFSPLVQAKVSKFELDNGMKILVKEDHRAPVVVHQIWYRVGSNYEQNGITGISHMLEHMMFKGTKTLKPGEFSKLVSKLGGQENAFTSSDYTAYYQVIGKQNLETVMKLEADRMRNLVIKDEEFQKERNVVTEERRWRTEDRPSAKLYEQFKAMAYMNSPNHHPVIGWMSDIRSWTASDLEKWYRRWYAPNNATLIVVGDVDPQQVYQLAKKYYGPNQPESIVQPKPQSEVVQEGERRLTLKGATRTPEILMGFHAPTLVTEKDEMNKKEVYALSVLGSILGGDSSSRFDKNLIRGSKLLASASAGVDSTDRLTTLFILQATPSQGISTADAEKALWEEIDGLKEKPVSKNELDRVLAQAEAAYVYHQDSIQAQAMILGSLVSVGLSEKILDNWIENLRKVTPEEIQAVAKKYLQKDKMTVATLLPNGKTASKLRAPNFHSGGIR